MLSYCGAEECDQAMKRDWDIIRKILAKVEELSAGKELKASDLPEDDPSLVNYNMGLLLGAKLVEGIDMSHMGGKFYMIRSLTWEGHEFLDAIRNESIWKETKDEAVKKGATLSFEIIKQLAISLTKAGLGLP